MAGTTRDVDDLLKRTRNLVARARRLTGTATATPRRDVDRRALLTLVTDLGAALVELRRHADATAREIDGAARRVSACLAYLTVGRTVHAPRR